MRSLSSQQISTCIPYSLTMNLGETMLLLYLKRDRSGALVAFMLSI